MGASCELTSQEEAWIPRWTPDGVPHTARLADSLVAGLSLLFSPGCGLGNRASEGGRNFLAILGPRASGLIWNFEHARRLSGTARSFLCFD